MKERKEKELTELVLCQCHSPEHQVLFRTIAGDDDVYMTIHLSSRPFLRRVVHAVRYIFGYRSKYGDFDEVVIGPSEAHKFKMVADWLVQAAPDKMTKV